MRSPWCSSGEAALSWLAQQLPDLVVLDLLMADVDGLTVLQRMKQDPRTSRIPVVVMTGADQPAKHEECLRAGAAAVVRKDVELLSFREKLLAAVHDWLPLDHPSN